MMVDHEIFWLVVNYVQIFNFASAKLFLFFNSILLLTVTQRWNSLIYIHLPR